MSQLINKFVGILPRQTPWISNLINSLISWVCSFTPSYLSDTDNNALLENTIPINLNNLINLLCVLLFWSFYSD